MKIIDFCKKENKYTYFIDNQNNTGCCLSCGEKKGE